MSIDLCSIQRPCGHDRAHNPWVEPPTSKSIGINQSIAHQPVTWTSLGLMAVTGAGLTYYYQVEKEKKQQEGALRWMDGFMAVSGRAS